MPETAAGERPAQAAPTPLFYIPATSSLLERRPRTLKHGDTFAVFDHYGNIVGEARSPEGVFHEDTRHLSHLELQVNGQRPLLLSSVVQDDNSVLTVDLTNPDIYRDGRLILNAEVIHLVRTKFLWEGVCYERVVARNFGLEPHSVSVSLLFAADFADLFEVRGHVRRRRGRSRIRVEGNNTVVVQYAGLDGTERRTLIRFEPAPIRLDSRSASFELDLAPHERQSLFIAVECNGVLQDQPIGFLPALRRTRRTLRAAASHAAAVASSNAVLNEILCRAISDLYMLVTHTPHGAYPYAGIPWFSTAFGRDGILTAIQMLWIDPSIARGVLNFLAATQAEADDPVADAEPGKILHETRNGEMARLGEVPFRLYYGSVDSTPLFVVLAGLYFERTGDVDTVNRLWPNIEAALRWIDSRGDRDGDGFVEYQRRAESGLANQGWKDSNDSMFHADGSLAAGPIAPCEVQAYAYAAKRHAATMARALGQSVAAATLDHQAATLRERFEDAFWCEELSTYALALDGNKMPCRVVSSNAGHALFGGIADPHRAERVADTLLRRESFSGWGIRTVAAAQPRYNPMSYHNGSIWPHDNALIALGFARYGLKEHALRVFTGLFAAATYMDQSRLPELFCGFPRRRRGGPTLYPVACSPQAWASVTPFALLQACLGLELDNARGAFILVHPRLPDFIDELCIRRLTLGDSEITLLLRRHANDVAVNVLARRGDAPVLIAT